MLRRPTCKKSFVVLFVGLQLVACRTAPEPSKKPNAPEEVAMLATRELNKAIDAGDRSSAELDRLRDQLSPKIGDETLRDMLLGSYSASVKRDLTAAWYPGREARLGPKFVAEVVDKNDGKVGSLLLAFAGSFVAGGGQFSEPITEIVDAYARYRKRFPTESGSAISLLAYDGGEKSQIILKEISLTGSPAARSAAKAVLTRIKTQGKL